MKTKHQILTEALTILEVELYPSAMEVHLLKARLSCRKCMNSSVSVQGAWVCSLYGPIPAEYLAKGCTNWVSSNRMCDNLEG